MQIHVFPTSCVHDEMHGNSSNSHDHQTITHYFLLLAILISTSQYKSEHHSYSFPSYQLPLLLAIMKLILLFSLCCICNSELQVYIAPDRDNCTVNATTVLHPCYTLHQIIEDKILSLSNENSVELLFLTGTHLIPENQILRTSNFRGGQVP